MANIKVIFKITFGLQLLVCAMATYGHPDAEFIDFGSPTQPSQVQLMIEAAVKRGMDREAVAELLRTKKPVVRTTTTPDGFDKTTTYKLEPDGSISTKSVMQKIHHYSYSSEDRPEVLKNSPTGSVTKTFTDSDGNQVTRTITVNHDNPKSESDIGDLSADWLRKPFGSWPSETPSSTAVHRTRTYTAPNGEKRTVQSWSSEPEIPEPKTPYGSKWLSTSTQTKPIGDSNWPSFDFSTFSKSWDKANTDDVLDDWEIVKDPEVTTKKTFEAWTPRTWNWPKFPTYSTSTTTTPKPYFHSELEPSSLKPLPNLDEFLATQYGRRNNRDQTTSTAKTSATTPKIIQIEDLPVVEVLYNGLPADENIMKTLPAHLTPRTPAEPVLSVQHKHQIEDDTEAYTPKKDTTNIRTFSTTLVGPEKPKLKDLNPQLQEILRNAGIVPEIEGDSVTKTRTEPDGRVITTTYKVNTVTSPTTVREYEPPSVTNYLYNSYNGYAPLAAFNPEKSSISEFLARLGLTKTDLTSRSGRYSKTLTDENGDALTATFVFTSRQQGMPKPLPFK